MTHACQTLADGKKQKNSRMTQTTLTIISNLKTENLNSFLNYANIE